MRSIGVTALVAVFSCAPARAAELTPEQWRQDLRVLSTELPRLHKNLFFLLPKPEFERRVRELDSSIPKLSDIEIRAALVRLLASAGNAHTTIDAFQGTPNFPLQFAIFPEGVFVTSAPPEHPEAVGARLAAVNGTSVEQVRQKLLPYFAKENDVALLSYPPGLLRNAAVLETAGIIDDLNSAEFTLERNGESSKLALHSGQKVATATDPTMNKRRKGDYSFEFLPEQEALYVQYNACRNMAQQTFKDFTGEVMKVAASKRARKFIVDLRFNGGGDSKVIQPLIQSIKSLHNVRVYALVGRYTFSSGFMAALDLKKNCRATLVGEAMGQRPNSYGDIRPLKLPNSGLTAYYCTQYFRLAKNDPPQIEPDIAVATKAADFFARRDPVLDYALSQ